MAARSPGAAAPAPEARVQAHLDPGAAPAAARRRELPTLELLALALVLAVLLRPRIAGLVDQPQLQTWSTIFVSITVQALPFLTLGVVVSGAIAALVPPGWLARVLPERTVLAVPAAGLAGMALPGCECGSVPIAGRLTARGAVPAAAFAFMLAAPAINPVVLVATAVAFPGQPRVVAARFAASFLTATVVGLLWSRVGREAWIDRARMRIVEGANRWESFTATARHDFLHAGGWLVAGALAAATLQVVVPRAVLDTVAGNEVAAVAALALLAVVLAICSEADAFVAASLSQFSLTSRLVFLVVGPAVDVKLVALQAGTFGRRFALRFAPLTLLVAVVVASLVGRVVLAGG
jgi:uncharacterized membrane protein YraQ (UPF0718 family)